MQKKLIALALASLAGTAFAQSNVTVYGVADMTLDNIKATGSGSGATDIKTRNKMTSNSSYVGFKGVEDLGNGLKAVFQLENGVSFDGAAGTWGNRDSYVGVAGGFGTIVAGNLTGPTRALGAKMDVNSGATGVGANTALLGKLGGGAGAGAFDQRLNNAVAYVSPNFSGFTGVVGYTTGFSNGGAIAGLTGAAKETAGQGPFANVNTGWTLGANYENGPIYVGYAYTAVDVQNGAPIAAGVTVDKLVDHRLAGQYKIGTMGQVGLMWDQARANLNGASDQKQNVYYLSGKFNVTPAGALVAQYGWAGDVKGSAAKERARHWEIGYEHSLSKRTIVKAAYTAISNNANTSYDFLFNATNATNSSALTAAGAAANADPKALSVGIRHSF